MFSMLGKRVILLAASGLSVAAVCGVSVVCGTGLLCGGASAATVRVASDGGFFAGRAMQQAAASGQAAVAQSVGTVKAINGNVLTMTLDGGNDVTVNVQDTTKIVQVAPGQKDIKNATPLKISDLQVGDRILVRSRASDDPKSVNALGI